MASSAPRTVGDLLAASRRLQRRVPSWYEWRDAVGSKIATRSRPYRVEQATLIVLVTSSTWAQELSLLQSAILPRLQGRFPQLRQLRYRIEAFTPPPAPPPRRALPPVALPDELERRLERVEDERLRETIRRAAALSLARRSNPTDAGK